MPRSFEDSLLSLDTVSALELAATRRDGRPITTFGLLAALIAVDDFGGWEAVQLESTYIDADEAHLFTDPRGEPRGSWHNVPLTADSAFALEAANQIADTYRLRPLPPGVLALGLVWRRDTGAAQALLEARGADHKRLLELIQDELLGGSLENLEGAVSSGDLEAAASPLSLNVAEEDQPNEGGWTPGWELYETPESRRLDWQVKLSAVITMVLLAAFCLQMVTLLVTRTGWWALLLVPATLWLTLSVGPPRHHPATGIVRPLLALAMGSGALLVVGVLLLASEWVDDFLMPRFFAAGRGGSLPSARETRRERIAGLRGVRESRRARVLAMLDELR